MSFNFKLTLMVIGCLSVVASGGASYAHSKEISVKSGKQFSSAPLYSYDTRSCEYRQPPELKIKTPPLHGKMNTAMGQTVIQDSGVCHGKTVKGVSISYIPEAGYVGSDGAVVVVNYYNGSGHVFKSKDIAYTFDVEK